MSDTTDPIADAFDSALALLKTRKVKPTENLLIYFADKYLALSAVSNLLELTRMSQGTQPAQVVTKGVEDWT